MRPAREAYASTADLNLCFGDILDTINTGRKISKKNPMVVARVNHTGNEEVVIMERRRRRINPDQRLTEYINSTPSLADLSPARWQLIGLRVIVVV